MLHLGFTHVKQVAKKVIHSGPRPAVLKMDESVDELPPRVDLNNLFIDRTRKAAASQRAKPNKPAFVSIAGGNLNGKPMSIPDLEAKITEIHQKISLCTTPAERASWEALSHDLEVALQRAIAAKPVIPEPATTMKVAKAPAIVESVNDSSMETQEIAELRLMVATLQAQVAALQLQSATKSEIVEPTPLKFSENQKLVYQIANNSGYAARMASGRLW